MKACRALFSAESSRCPVRKRRKISPKRLRAWRKTPTPQSNSGHLYEDHRRRRARASGPFKVEQIDLCDPRADELLVEVVASGMCATDMHGRDAYYPTTFPKVFGHEGAGVVRAVGSGVTKFKPGDHVVMAYPWCGECPNCKTHRQSYCLHAFDLKMNGTRADGSTLHSKDGKPIYSAFFQQSSFGNFTIANERFAVKVRNDAPLEQRLRSCLRRADRRRRGAQCDEAACGRQFRGVRRRRGRAIRLDGRQDCRLRSDHCRRCARAPPFARAQPRCARTRINHSGRTDVVAEIRKITGLGARFTLETSALPEVFREAVDCLMPAGTCVLLGSARKGTEVSFETPFLQNGRTVRGVIQGDSVPQEFIPQLVDHIMAGRFAVDRMITYYPLAEINRAAAESAAGKTIKPVIRMPH